MLRNEAVISCRTIWSKISDIKQRLTEMGSPVAGTPDQFGALIRSEMPKWGKVVKQANVSLD